MKYDLPKQCTKKRAKSFKTFHRFECIQFGIFPIWGATQRISPVFFPHPKTVNFLVQGMLEVSVQPGTLWLASSGLTWGKWPAAHQVPHENFPAYHEIPGNYTKFLGCFFSIAQPWEYPCWSIHAFKPISEMNGNEIVFCCKINYLENQNLHSLLLLWI